MDVDKLLNALDDETNITLLNFTTKTIKELNRKIINELSLSKEEKLSILKKLDGYKYVDEPNDLKYGAYIRWISLEDTENGKAHLAKGAIFCELKISDSGMYCVCKNYGYYSKCFQLSMDKHLLFQKLTNQELVLLSALDHLAK
jgi:hypothetical protein